MNKTILCTAVAMAMAMCLAQRSVCDNVTKSNDVTFSIISPRDSSLWVATKSRGILRVGRTGRAFSYSSANGDFPCDNIVSLAFDSLAVLWMRDARDGVYSYTSLDGFRKQNDIPESVLKALWTDNSSEDVTFSKADDEVPESARTARGHLPAWPFILLSTLLLLALLYVLLSGRKVKQPDCRPVNPSSIKPSPEPETKPKHEPEPKAEPQPDPSGISKSGDFSAKVSEIIDANYTNPDFSVEEIADILGITRVHLNRKLKMENSPSPKAMLKKVRMEKAAEMLKQGVPVANIASECGFSSPSYFSSAFKEYFGVSPKAFQ